MRFFLRGETVTVKAGYRSSITIPTAPTWRLLDADGRSVLTGTSTLNNQNQWTATVSLPLSYPVQIGVDEEMTLEFEGTDTRGRVQVATTTMYLHSAVEEWRSYGLLIQAGAVELKESAVFPSVPTSVVLKILEGYGDASLPLRGNITVTNPTFSFFTSSGYAYDFTLPITTPITEHSGGMYPFQLQVTANFSGGKTDTITKPVYVLTRRILNLVTSLKRFLDKARIQELDQNLQWQDDEYVHFILEGCSYLNGIKDLTFWTPENFPTPLESYLVQAAAWTALNARYLAEGMTSFEFNGANTQLTYNRREAIQVKMDELRSVLDTNFLIAKTAAIRRFGVGTAPAGAVGITPNRVGSIGVQLGPNTNRSGFYNRNRSQGSSGTWRF